MASFAVVDGRNSGSGEGYRDGRKKGPRTVTAAATSLLAEHGHELPYHGSRGAGVLPGDQVPVGDRELAPGCACGEVGALGAQP